MFKVKNIEIDISHQLVALINKKDAKELGLDSGERVKIVPKHSDKSIICQLEILDKKNSHYLKQGEIGIYENAFQKLGILENTQVDLFPAAKPKSLDYVKKKFLGARLTEQEFLEIMKDIVSNSFSEVETTYFVLACTINSLNDKEVINLTKAMVCVGKKLNFKKSEEEIIVDKHCIGGVPGNRTTPIIISILASSGLKIPKTSSRAITSPAGTADTMEIFATVKLPLSEMYSIVNETNGCLIWGGGLDLSPADDLIIQVEHPLELDSEGQMIASILSKKKSVGSTHVLIDIPVGINAKVKNKLAAYKLKRRFEKIGKALDMTIKVIITDGNSPIGYGMGPLYEAKDILNILENNPNQNNKLREKTLIMSGELFEMSKLIKKGKGYEHAKTILESGKALHKFNEIIELQGKNKNLELVANYSFEIKAKLPGILKYIDNKLISRLAFILGAPKDKTAGLIIKKEINQRVQMNENILTIYSNSELKLKYAHNFFKENDFMLLIK